MLDVYGFPAVREWGHRQSRRLRRPARHLKLKFMLELKTADHCSNTGKSLDKPTSSMPQDPTNIIRKSFTPLWSLTWPTRERRTHLCPPGKNGERMRASSSWNGIIRIARFPRMDATCKAGRGVWVGCGGARTYSTAPDCVHTSTMQADRR